MARTLHEQARHRPVEQRDRFDRKHCVAVAERFGEALGCMDEGGVAVAMREQQPLPLRRAPRQPREYRPGVGLELDPVAAYERQHLLVVLVGLAWRRYGRVGD